MSELTQGPGERQGKFASDRDQLLYYITLEGWGVASGGDVQSPSGWFGRISTTEAELPGVEQAFGEQISSSGVAPAELVGHFLLNEDSQGFVYVTEYGSERDLLASYGILEEVYEQWWRISHE